MAFDNKLEEHVLIHQLLGVAAGSGISDHGDLSGLSDDDHSIYAYLTGRSTGQVFTGGTQSSATLTLRSTSHSTKGKILFGNSAYDEVNNRLGIGLSTPLYAIDTTGQIRTTIITGTPPFVVASTTLNDNLNADLLDGNHASAFALSGAGVTNGNSHDHSGGDGAQIDHTGLSSIGINSHLAIDSHINDSSIHFTSTSINHGDLISLSDDDHPQYALLSGRGNFGTALSSTEITVSGNIIVTGTVDGIDISAHNHSGAGGQAVDHGNLTGLTDDDHLQYARLANRGNFGTGISSTGLVVSGVVGIYPGSANYGITTGYGIVIYGPYYPSSDCHLHIRPSSGKNGYLAFTEDNVADRGILGYAAGSADLVYRSAASSLSDGTERFRIAGSTGNFGINTSSTTNTLTVNGAASIGNAYISTAAPTDGLIVKGKVGFQFSNPTYDFEVHDNGGNAGIAFSAGGQNIGATYGTGGHMGLYSEVPGSSTGSSIFLGASARGDANQNAILFKASTTEYMRIDGNYSGHTIGNVGIGNTSPTYKLDVLGTIRSNNSDYGSIQLGNADSGGFHLVKESSDDSFRIYSGAVGSGIERFRIATDGIATITSGLNIDRDLVVTGRVGIGTSPSYKLHVLTNASGGPAAFFHNQNSAGYGITIETGPSDQSSGTYYYLICKDGGGVDNGYIYNVSDTMTFATTSDARLKSNIADTKVDGLDTISKVKLREFNFTGKAHKHKIGFVAQELEPVIPEAVVQGPEGNYAVSKTEIVPYLVKAIQELTKRIEELEAKN